MMGKRITYIDAMRGFTMILVVYSHMCGFCLGSRHIALNDILFLFRLPCFFFISGWLFYGAGREWNRSDIFSVIKKKFMVQIVPTIIFLFLISPPPEFITKLGATKGGYWFTFALFEYFIIYMVTMLPFRRQQDTRADLAMLLTAVVISMVAYWYDINYHRLSTILTWEKQALGFLSFIVWRYYLFFFLGTLAKKYFPDFLQLLSHRWLVVSIVIGFFLIAMIPQSNSYTSEYFKYSMGGILGMVMIFALFRAMYASASFHLPSFISSPLPFIGTRTLDIYLLHYFFLPEFLFPHAQRILASIPCLILPLPIFFASLIVVALCLATSWLIRLCPFLAHYLFGAKKPNLLTSDIK